MSGRGQATIGPDGGWRLPSGLFFLATNEDQTVFDPVAGIIMNARCQWLADVAAAAVNSLSAMTSAAGGGDGN
jgi:hypothetical protein